MYHEDKNIQDYNILYNNVVRGLTFHSHVESPCMSPSFHYQRRIGPIKLVEPRIETAVSSQKSERSCICVLGVLILLLSMILTFDFELF